jgi:hypothetical protein
MRVAHIDGVLIPADWPQVRPNSKVRTPAAVEVARLLIRPKSASVPTRPKSPLSERPADFPPDSPKKILGSENSSATPTRQAEYSGGSSSSRTFFENSCPVLQASPRFEPHQENEGVRSENNEVRMKKKKSKKLPDAIEAARALVKVNAKSPATKAPIQFDRCDDDPADNIAPAKRRGRIRTQPPSHLRDEMPEHSDAAYFEAQGQLRQPSEQNGGPRSNGTVPASDYHRGGPRLSSDEIEKIIELYTNEYGAILRLDDAAEVTKLSKQTLRRKVCEGKFVSSVFRGTPLRFITRRLIEEVLG